MASPKYQIEFLSNIQRLLSEGSFVSTYKYALLLALADLCVELGGDDDAPLEVSTVQLGEKFTEYYWRQCAPYQPIDGENIALLRQNTGEMPRILRLLRDQHERHQGSLVSLRRDQPAWNRTLAQITTQVVRMPLWKLQTIGSQTFAFLYDNEGVSDHIILKPGVAFSFRRHYSLIVDLVKGAWARFVRRYNADRLAERVDLHEFLFGSERADLSGVRPILHQFQQGSCFYCEGTIQAQFGEVDHFVPWSRYPVDLGHNFVLACSRCNGQKSDRLPAVRHLQAWTRRSRDHGEELGMEFQSKGVACDLPVSTRVIGWAYRQTAACQGMTWLRANESEPLPIGWKDYLPEL